MAHPNEELLRRGYEAFAKGDLDTVMSIFDEDIGWHEPGRNPLGGDLKGHQQVQELFGRIFEMSGGTFSIEIHDIVADDEHAVAMVRTRASGRASRSTPCKVMCGT